MYKTPIDICFYTVSSLYAFHAGIVKPSKEKVLRNSADEGSEAYKELLHSDWQEATGCFHSKVHFHAGWAEHLETKYWRHRMQKEFSCFCIGELSNFIT